MFFPLTVRDFIDRAETVYPERVAVVDEPDQPAPSLGELTYRQLASNARAQAAKLDQLGVPADLRDIAGLASPLPAGLVLPAPAGVFPRFVEEVA